jgi:hypothetical protein
MKMMRPGAKTITMILALQALTDRHCRLLPAATGLLVSLTNPLNVTLLTSHLLFTSSLWSETHDLRATLRFFRVFYTSALQVSQQSASDTRSVYKPLAPLDKERWATAVMKGADDRSPRWRHVLMLGAILLGFEEKQKQCLPLDLRSSIESAIVTATNTALEDHDHENNTGKYALAFVLNYTFELLADYNRALLKYHLILPILIEATFSSPEGLHNGYWLGVIDQDVVEVGGRKFNWSERSNTYRLIREMQERPLISSLGPMSRLIAHSVGCVHDVNLVLLALDRIVDFARTLSISWRHNKLSEIDVSEELDFLDLESTKTTLPILWHILRLSLFAIVVIMRAVIGRLLSDGVLASDLKAPFLAMQCLHVLRNLYFVSSRLGQTSSSQYVFVNMVAIDVLTQYPEQAENFLQRIMPAEMGQMPAHPADRCLDLFFFNTAEHFTLALPSQLNEEVVLAGAMPYLAAGHNKHLVEIFEAAHSVTLSVFAAPHNAEVAARHLPFYLDALFKCFPDTLSARQFRLAFKTIVRISSPPSPLAQSQPLLPSILLETIYDRSKDALTNALPQATLTSHTRVQEQPLSEQAVLVMALIDSLCFLHPALLQEWLPLTASVVTHIEDPDMRRVCQDRFWEAMSSGEMDVEKAAVCVAWWSSRGGREEVLHSHEAQQNDHVMSGALPVESKL